VRRDTVRRILVCQPVEIVKIDAEVRTLDAQIARDRHAIEEWQRQGTPILKSLDDWVELDRERRAETRQKAVNALIATALAALRVGTVVAEAGEETRVDEAWKAYRESPLSSVAFREYVRQHERATVAIRAWRDAHEMVESFERFHVIVETMNAAQHEEYALALMHVALVAAPDPRLQTLASELEFTAAAITANATAWVARRGVNRLLEVTDDRLKAIASLSKTYCDHVSARKALLKRRAELEATP